MATSKVVQEVEVWKPAPGYESKLEISSFGRIRRPRGNTRQAKMLRCRINTSGYLYYRSQSEGKRRAILIHRLVATAFIPNPENKPVVNHIDNNPANSHVSNLEWCTVRENILHCQRQGRGYFKDGGNHPDALAVNAYDADNKLIHEFGTIRLAAAHYKICATAIAREIRLNRLHFRLKVRFEFVNKPARDNSANRIGNYLFTLEDALLGISDMRFLVAIMFGRTDAVFVQDVLIKSGYAYDSSNDFVNRLRHVHTEWIKSDGKLIVDATKM